MGPWCSRVSNLERYIVDGVRIDKGVVEKTRYISQLFDCPVLVCCSVTLWLLGIADRTNNHGQVYYQLSLEIIVVI